MRLSFRFIFPLAITLALFAWALVPLAENLGKRWFMHDLQIRAELVFHSLEESLPPLLQPPQRLKIKTLLDKYIRDERLYAIGFCDLNSKLLFRTVTFPNSLGCAQTSTDGTEVLDLSSGPLHVFSRELSVGDKPVGRLIVVHDMSFVKRRSEVARNYIFGLFAGLGAVISILTIIIAEISLKGWVKGLRAVLNGGSIFRPTSLQRTPELKPLAKDLQNLVRELSAEKGAMEWTPKRLKEVLQKNLFGEEVLVVSNREPYIHETRNGKVEIQVPASGLVTALEPVMRACSGVWIAHGSGSADKDAVDRHDRVRVPPSDPCYQIRRVWLTNEEESGYYYGFSNEGLWPLCHMAHTRPIFRTADWVQYQNVNQKFADAVVEESKTSDPVILVQDYHFALLPKMIRERLPRATIITFWHIPWPNAEAFGILPWRDQLLEGLLGSSILGFHTRFHCTNFINSVDRSLEARIERETSTIFYGGKQTTVNHYPISIEWSNSRTSTSEKREDACQAIRKLNSIGENVKLGIGVDRLDYTKGILERFLAVERLLETHPEWVGRFSFIQIAAPSRSRIEHYRSFESQVKDLAESINKRFSQPNYQPIHLKMEHQKTEEVYRYYRAAELCFVTSLHDGMNLVAKEFVSSRDDEGGVLVLSQFTGAALELSEALIVNPYDTDECAEALFRALTMSKGEQRERMRSLRFLVREFNVYRWAGKMLLDAARIRSRRKLLEHIPLAGQIIKGSFGA